MQGHKEHEGGTKITKENIKNVVGKCRDTKNTKGTRSSQRKY